MAGKAEAKKVTRNIVAYVDNWLKDLPDLDKEITAIPANRKVLEEAMKEAFKQGYKGWYADVNAYMRLLHLIGQ